jgi:hypothetical protein
MTCNINQNDVGKVKEYDVWICLRFVCHLNEFMLYFILNCL